MKVQLVVVRGKPEGKVIPLVGPNFKIGRGETCHLRPNSEQVSREHAEFVINADSVLVRDLGSRNGTLVNGKALTADCRLKDRDLVQVGPLTFAVSIAEVPVAKAAVVAPAAPAAVKAKSPDDVSGDEIDSWLLGEAAGAAAENPTVYGGDTITITAFKDAKSAPAPVPAPAAASAPAKPQPPPSASDDEYERQAEEDESVDEVAETAEDLSGEGGTEELGDDFSEGEDEGEGDDEEAAPEEEFIDESNPFFAAKKALKEQAKQGAAGPAKPSFKDTSDAANDILRRLMERRRASKG
jgi:pSer/pThr/pTyr-binding forkhead associated (FHA) protein